MATERDYVLGTHDQELVRLGLQHRVWRPVTLDCWERAGVTVGKHVLDLGAGPGYATIDLAEIVGPSGSVTALERSGKFVSALKQSIRARLLNNVEVFERDLMIDDLPEGPFDFSWCRWVITFVTDPGLVIRKLATVLRTGGRAIFHEYGHYETWRFVPPMETHEYFRDRVVAAWRESGGQPDAAQILPRLLGQNGFVVRSIRPHIFCVRPNEYIWQWPKTFIEVYLPQLVNEKRIDEELATRFRSDLARAESDPNTVSITPLVLEIVAEKIAS
jgi:SAM-dependent methyltransferase